MRRHNRQGWGRLALAFGAATLLLAAAAPVDAQDAFRRPDPRKTPQARAQTQSKFNLATSATFFMNFNAWQCGLHQIGEVCSSSVGSSVGGGGFWPIGTANQYIFNSGLQVAATIGPDGGAAANDTVATFFFNASGNGAGASVTPIYASNRPEDVAAWPQDCYLDNPVFGRVKTLSELDTCVQYWDGDPTAAHFTDSRPMGLLVTQHSLLWSFPSNKDIMFFIYKFRNVSNTAEFRARNPQAPAGGWTLNNVYAAFAMDPDVSGGEYSENFATVVPELDLGAAWMYDFEASDFVPYAPNFDAAPGFVGVKFLKSPVHTGDEPRTVTIGNRTRVVNKGEELGMTFFSIFTNGGIMSDASNASQAFRYLSGQLLATERAQWCPSAPAGMCYVNLAGPDDMRFYQASGPFTLKPGEEQEIVVAYVAGAPVPGTYTKGTVIPVGDVMNEGRAIEAVMGRGFDRPGFPSLFANANAAQAIYDADFVLPSSPAAPIITVVPGDRQNSVIWDASAVTREDPYCQLAGDEDSPLYDPAFRCQDFEGFRIYRKSNPSADWTPIAQFDIKNGIAEVVTVLEEVETADGSVIVVKADTARVCLNGTKEQLGLASDFSGCTAETGLKYGIIDRGGAFPNPENGPGLINGVRYYYAVTSFDINSPQSGPNSLESARVLNQAASAVPRANAAGYIAADISEVQYFGDTTTPLNVNAVAQINPQTGSFTATLPPSNGLAASFAAYNPQLLKAGNISVRVDSVVALNGYEWVLGTHEQLNPGACLSPMSTAYFFTVTTPTGTEHVRTEYPTPFSIFSGCESEASTEFVTPLQGDPARAQELGVQNSYAGAFNVAVSEEYRGYNSANASVIYTRTHVVGPENRSMWFTGANESGRNDHDVLNAGTLPGVTKIYNMAYLYNLNANTRWMTYTLSPLSRTADFEITWGANGQISKVRDLSNQVDVPFSDHYGATWGVRNNATGAVLSYADFWHVTPLSEWWYESPGFHRPLEQTAKIQPMATTAPAGSYGTSDPAAGANTQGFGLYISGEFFLFETSTLPASGTVWKLRQHQGIIEEQADGTYAFTPLINPPAVPGLKAQLTIGAGATVDMAAADVERVHTVPDPYYVTNKLENTSAVKKMQFVNLPAQATIRIYSLSGVLVAVLNHDDASGGGTLDWDLRTRNNQFVASGVYFFHVEAPNGKTKVGKFTIIQYAQ